MLATMPLLKLSNVDELLFFYWVQKNRPLHRIAHQTLTGSRVVEKQRQSFSLQNLHQHRNKYISLHRRRRCCLQTATKTFRTEKLKMESVASRSRLSLWLFAPVYLCVCACVWQASQAEQQWSDFFCPESQSQKEIKEQLSSTTALAPEPKRRLPGGY